MEITYVVYILLPLGLIGKHTACLLCSYCVLSYCTTFALCRFLKLIKQGHFSTCAMNTALVCALKMLLSFFFCVEYLVCIAHCHQTSEVFKRAVVCTHSVYISMGVLEFSVFL